MWKLISSVALAYVLAIPIASAHCDSMDGPVVRAATLALASGNVNPVLPWVHPDQESAVRDAFHRTLEARKLSSEAKDLADYRFFEAVVRIHRAGEGESYEGLKPSGAVISPAVAAADEAIETGDIRKLEPVLAGEEHDGLREKFRVLLQLKRSATDVTTGRQYVAAYVDYIHTLERLEAGADSGPEQAGRHSH